jgi:hypothetical protein
MEPRIVGPVTSERQLFDQLTKLRNEQLKLRDQALVRPPDKAGVARLHQIDVETNAVWSGIRETRAANRAAHRARFASSRDTGAR